MSFYTDEQLSMMLGVVDYMSYEGVNDEEYHAYYEYIDYTAYWLDQVVGYHILDKVYPWTPDKLLYQLEKNGLA
jgi:hypothetical protein